MKAKKRKKKTNKFYFRFKVMVTLAILTTVFLLVIKFYNNKVMPTVRKTMEHYGTVAATKVIDESVKVVIDDSKVTSEDLFTKTTNTSGKLTSLSADTVLINNICSSVSKEVAKNLSELGNENVYLPIGIISGYDFLSAKGPKVFKIAFQPIGECIVDYDTSFKSEGINQINYQIWLNVNTKIVIVNPLTNENMTVSRKVPIVNAYINGDVPESMLYPFPSGMK